MKFFLIAIAAFAAATSSIFIVSATAAAAAAASRNRKIAKKGGSLTVSYGATGPPTPDGIPFGGECVPAENDCAIPLSLTHGVCRSTNDEYHPYYNDYQCQSGQPGSSCGVTDDCVVPPGLGHAVCRDNVCQR